MHSYIAIPIVVAIGSYVANYVTEMLEGGIIIINNFVHVNKDTGIS